MLPPGWAAVYIGLSLSSFRRSVAPGLRTVALTERRRGYLREDLDAWVDRQAGVNTRSAEDEWMDGFGSGTG